MNNVNKEKILKKITPGTETYSFAKGWFQAYELLPEPKMKMLQQEIMQALDKVNPVTFWRRLTGQYCPTIAEAAKIIEVFNKYGITQVFYDNAEDFKKDVASLG